MSLWSYFFDFPILRTIFYLLFCKGMELGHYILSEKRELNIFQKWMHYG